MNTSTFDHGIPELTEVIPLAPPVAPAAVEPTADATPAKAAAPAHGLADWTDAEWHRLESDVRERIARQVLGRIDFVLEQRVRDSLADVLQTAVEDLAAEIKRGLHHTLEDVISRAVAQEISRLKTTK